MIALLTTADPVKLSAAEAVLTAAGVVATVFDRAVGTLWTSIIPFRLMIASRDIVAANAAMSSAGWAPAADGEWDLATRED